MERQNVDFKKIKNIHLMGVGGAGMSGLALLFSQICYNVTGCDTACNDYSKKVENAGVHVLHGHNVEHLDDCKVDLLAYSSAIPADNPELCEARRRGIPVMQRAELLSALFDYKKGIGVAGTHGKTTTTSLISVMLDQAKMEPTIAVGGELFDIGTNAKLGKGEYMVAELDESDQSFEFFHPFYSVVTNVDWDHVNQYPNIEAVIEAFVRFLCNNKDGGKIFVCGEDDNLKRVVELLPIEFQKRVLTFGRNSSYDFYANDVQYRIGGGVTYTLYAHGKKMGSVDLIISGAHNVIDSLAACAVAYELGIPFEIVQKSMRMFHGAKRRMQMRALCVDNILVYDDYGHHPSEIKATLAALRQMHPDRRILLVFQPHRYTRTQALFDRFASVLAGVPQVILLPIYAADEQPISGVSSEQIADAIKKLGGSCTLVGDKDSAVAKVLELLRPHDLLLTVGAGDVYQIGDAVIDRLQRFSIIRQ